MFDMNVAGAVVRGVSMMYATTVGKVEATASVMMAPDADQVNISICPGVSRMKWLHGVSLFLAQPATMHSLDRIRTLLHQAQHLVKLRRKQVERGQNPSVRP